MHRLVYRSVSALPRGTALQGLGALLEQCLTHNAALGVTGVLAFDGESFMQVLEGPADTLDALFARIGDDPRHRDVELLLREPAERRFAIWSMALVYRDPRLPIVFARVGASPVPAAGHAAVAMLAALVAETGEAGVPAS